MIKLFFIIFLLFTLSGCTSVSKDAGFAEIREMVQHRSEQIPIWLRAESELQAQQLTIRSMLANSLTADDVVCIMLMNNFELQARLMELGIAQADLVQASRIRNPSISYLKLTPVQDEYNIERRIIFDVMSLLTLPMRRAIEKKHFEQTKLHIAIKILEKIAQTRKAYYAAIASEQKLRYLKEILDASKASAQLAQKMAETGNWNKLQQTREQVFYAQLAAEFAKAQLIAIKDREHLTRVMGLWGEDICFILPERLPDLPAILDDPCLLEQDALINRLDIQAMKLSIEQKAKALGLTQATRFINIFDLGYEHTSGINLSHQTGYEISLEIPIFDWGEAKLAKAQSIYMQSIWQLRARAIEARSEVREYYQIFRIAYDIAQHYQCEIIPIRQKMLEETILRYNGMLLSTFELLNDKMQQIASVNAYIDKLLDFWIAEINLQTAMMNTSPEKD